MASFLTQCPGCMTSFRVSDAQLEAAEGMVRCGACLSVFSAPANRITLRKPFDPSQLPVLEPDAELEEEQQDEVDDELQATLPVQVAAPDDDEDELDDEDESAAEDDDSSELWLVDARDRDVPLGDLDLDLLADDDEDEDFNDDFDDDDDDDDDDDFDDEDEDEDGFDDDDLIDDEDDALTEDEVDVTEEFEDTDDEDEEEEIEEELPEFSIVEEYVQEPVVVEEEEYQHADKRELREYLAALEDEDALEPLSDYDLDALSTEPVTIREGHTVRRTLRFMGMLLLNLVLIAVLALQYVNANLDTLSRSQRFAPLMNRVCLVLECPLPEQSDLGSLSSQDLLVRSHPRYAGALEVSFIFRNDAPDAQPFPAIELGFSDAANQLIANRLFQPADYLPPELQQLPAMPGQATLQITLELADPGSEAVNYSIGFRAP